MAAAAPPACSAGALEDGETRSFEWFSPAGFARDSWMANHLANRAKAGPSTEVVLVGDSITDAWGLAAPPSVCDALQVEQRVNALASNNHMGYFKGVLMQVGLIWVWGMAYVFGADVRISAMAYVMRVLMDFPRPAFVRGMASGASPTSCVSMGIMGDRTRHLQWRVLHGELDLAWGRGPNRDATPLKVVVMLIGVNNLGYKEYSPEETARWASSAIFGADHPHLNLLLPPPPPTAHTPPAPRRHIVNCGAVIASRYEGVQVLIHQLLPADNTVTPTRADRASVAKVNMALGKQLQELQRSEGQRHNTEGGEPVSANIVSWRST